jgi:hypothetical protein
MAYDSGNRLLLCALVKGLGDAGCRDGTAGHERLSWIKPSVRKGACCWSASWQAFGRTQVVSRTRTRVPHPIAASGQKRRGRALAASPETCWSECRPVPRSPLNPKNGTSILVRRPLGRGVWTGSTQDMVSCGPMVRTRSALSCLLLGGSPRRDTARRCT